MNATIPSLQKYLQSLLSTLLILLPLSIIADENITLKEVHDFQELSREMQILKLPLLLVFRADYCDYCRQLEHEHLIPMEKSGKYAARILIRRFSIDKAETVIDFQGQTLSAEAFATKYQASLTPTVLFLNADGQPVAEPLLGYNSPDYYGAYLEKAIVQAQQAVQKQP